MELHSSLESLNQIMHRERYCAVSYSNVELLKKRPGKVAVLYCTGELVNQIMSSFRAEVQYCMETINWTDMFWIPSSSAGWTLSTS
jgi:hypothetical protein